MTTPIGFPLGEHGRLGNCLFQLAATVGVARSLDAPVLVDADWPYLPFLSVPDGWVGKGRYIDARSHVDGSHWRRTYLQDPSLWGHCADEIRAAFQPSPRARAVLAAIPEPEPTDVALHVRRTDYLTMPDHLPVLSASYYLRAAGEHGADCPLPLTFHAYGDDREWAEANLGAEWLAHDANGDDPCDWLDLFLMARYSRLIIANSSYSWWAAWLAGPDAHVVAPETWFGRRIDTPSPALDRWAKVAA